MELFLCILAFCPHATCALGHWKRSSCKTAARGFSEILVQSWCADRSNGVFASRHQSWLLYLTCILFPTGNILQWWWQPRYCCFNVAMLSLCLAQQGFSVTLRPDCVIFQLAVFVFKSSAIMNPVTCCFPFVSSICPNIPVPLSFSLSDT